MKNFGFRSRSVANQLGVEQQDPGDLSYKPGITALINPQVKKGQSRLFMEFRAVKVVAADDIQCGAPGDERGGQTQCVSSVVSTSKECDQAFCSGSSHGQMK